MDDYLNKIDYDFDKTRYILPDELLEIVSSDFICFSDCTLLRIYPNSIIPNLESDYDKCNWEYNENHFHPDAFCQTGNEIEYLKCALECGRQLSNRLQNDFSDKKFRVSISFSETLYVLGEIEYYGSSTVRFHEIRPVADLSLKIVDLNSFKSDAVMELET